MTNGQKYFDLMCCIHEKVVGMVGSLHFDKTHPWHLHLVSLYCTMMELMRSACILLRQNAGVAVPIVLRSFVEAHIDFLNLAKDRTYGYRMDAASLREWVKLIREAGCKNNPFLKGLAELANSQSLLVQWEDKLRVLKEKGYAPLTLKEKFQTANLEDVYASLYNDLCCEAHNNIRSLTSRHVNIAEDGADFEVQLFLPVCLDDFVAEMDTFCGITLETTKQIHDLLENGQNETLLALNQDLDELRKTEMTEQAAMDSFDL